MKNSIFSLLMLLAISLVSCNNPSNEESLQKKNDSIKKADSIAQVMEQQRVIDSIASVTKEQEIIQDSIMKLVDE